ncbi:MAG: rhodanese-like domain-containing protein [Alphaproteobacteria bacterium]|nr:rhodanese-like domain-containing protein [Alphaproteobacteria bacterium]
MSVSSDVVAHARPHAAGFQDLPPAVAARNLGVFRVIDVREPSEYTGPLGHVPGAELLPLGAVPQRAHEVASEARPLLVVCRSGGRSAHAAAMLARAGAREVFNLDGGMLAWSGLSLPVEHGR